MLHQTTHHCGAFGMTHSARHVALLRPTAIAIHDDGDMLRQGGVGLFVHELNVKRGSGTLPPIAIKQSHLFSYKNGAQRHISTLNNAKRLDSHGYFLRLPQQLNQHKRTRLAIMRQVLTLQPLQWPSGYLHGVTGRKHPLQGLGRSLF